MGAAASNRLEDTIIDEGELLDEDEVRQIVGGAFDQDEFDKAANGGTISAAVLKQRINNTSPLKQPVSRLSAKYKRTRSTATATGTGTGRKRRNKPVNPNLSAESRGSQINKKRQQNQERDEMGDTKPVFSKVGSHGKLDESGSTVSFQNRGAAVMANLMTTGLHVMEVEIQHCGSVAVVGLCSANHVLHFYPGEENQSWALCSDGDLLMEGKPIDHHKQWVDGDRVRMIYNADEGTLDWWRNGTRGSTVEDMFAGVEKVGLRFSVGGWRGTSMSLLEPGGKKPLPPLLQLLQTEEPEEFAEESPRSNKVNFAFKVRAVDETPTLETKPRSQIKNKRKSWWGKVSKNETETDKSSSLRQKFVSARHAPDKILTGLDKPTLDEASITQAKPILKKKTKRMSWRKAKNERTPEDPGGGSKRTSWRKAKKEIEEKGQAATLEEVPPKATPRSRKRNKRRSWWESKTLSFPRTLSFTSNKKYAVSPDTNDE